MFSKYHPTTIQLYHPTPIPEPLSLSHGLPPGARQIMAQCPGCPTGMAATPKAWQQLVPNFDTAPQTPGAGGFRVGNPSDFRGCSWENHGNLMRNDGNIMDIMI